MPNKNYLTIKEVSKLVGVPSHTLRYWEKEFAGFLHPRRSTGGHRHYLKEDLAILIRIKRMLRNEKYSIAGAKQQLYATLTSGNTFAENGNRELVARLLELLKSPGEVPVRTDSLP